ncbi:hypothetical protein ACFQO9_20070 [Chryseobacterium zhengzhouense]|uniref:Nuclear transport factor 2 family protein n=2 Tax=Chryseobacterium TaxID=59732 RepID=A0ABW2M444_9FLAO
MEEIKEFIINFTKQEAETIYLRRQPDLAAYNKALQIMNDYCVEPLHDSFSMIPLTKLYGQEYYDEWSKKEYPRTRDIYKISCYENEKYGEVYIAYLSLRTPNRILTYGDCLFVTKIDGNLMIVKSYLFTSDVGKKKKFEFPTGLEDISFKTLKKPVKIERYLEPIHDEDGMEHYLKDI